MAKDDYRDYMVKKCIRARTALEAIELSHDAPVIEVYEMKEVPGVSNAEQLPTNAVGFQAGR